MQKKLSINEKHKQLLIISSQLDALRTIGVQSRNIDEHMKRICEDTLMSLKGRDDEYYRERDSQGDQTTEQ